MEFIGLIAGKSGDSLLDHLHKLKYKVALVSGSPNEPGVGLADAKLIIDLKNKSEILEFFNKFGVTKVIFGTGHILVNDLADYLEKEGLFTSIDIKNSELTKNKFEFKNAISSLGFKTPEYQLLLKEKYDSFDDKSLEFPIVLKSISDIVMPVKVNDLREFNEAIIEMFSVDSQVLLEKFIEGVECTVAIKSDGKSIRDVCLLNYSKAKEKKLKGFNGGDISPLPNEIRERLIKDSIDLVCKMNIIGLVRIDYVIKDFDFYILELNSVIMTGYNCATYPFFLDQGVDIAKEMIENSLSILRNKNRARS